MSEPTAPKETKAQKAERLKRKKTLGPSSMPPQNHLKPVVYRIGAIGFVEELLHAGYGSLLRAAGARVQAVGRKQQVKLAALGANVTHGEDHVAEKLVFQGEVPRLRIGPAEIAIGRVGIMNGVGR